MNDFKYAFYYTTRNILWQYAYGFLYGLVFGFLTFLVNFTCGLLNVGEETGEIVALVFTILLVLGIVGSFFFAYKKALQKVFFKPYKRFILIPKIEKITTKMVLFFILLSISTFLIPWSVGALMKPYFNVGDEFNAELIKYGLLSITCGLPISYMYILFINRYFVCKYATIVSKTKDDDTTHYDGV